MRRREVFRTRVMRFDGEAPFLQRLEQQFIVDFMGPSLAALPSSAAVRAVVSAPANGEILETNAYYLEATGAWRMMVLIKQLDVTKPVELRGFLQNGTDVLTETWSNLVPPR
jgi:glucans biosynthesis protein